MKASHVFHLLMGILLVGNSQAQAFGELVDLSRVASVLEYPANKLTISDLTQEGQRRHGTNVLSAYKLESADRTFAPMIFLVATKGMILSDELEAQIIKSQKAASNDQMVKAMARRIEFRNGAYGYTGLAGVGPGGTEELFIATLPKQNVDVQIKIVIPGEDLLAVTPETEAYHHLITEGGDELVKRVIECAEATIAKATLMSAPSVQQTPVRPVPPSTSSVVGGDNSTPSLESSDPRSSPAVKAELLKSFPWPWIIGSILLLAVLGGSLLKIRRK